MTSLSLEGSLNESLQEHRRILNALKNHDLNMAKKHLEAHLLRALEKLKDCVSQREHAERRTRKTMGVER